MNDRLTEYREEQAGWSFLAALVAIAAISYALGFVTCVLL